MSCKTVKRSPSSLPFREVSVPRFTFDGSLNLITMQRQLVISTEPIDEAARVACRRRSSRAGAVVHFLGVVRDSEAGEPIGALEYESFQPMAEHQFHRLFDEVERRWPIESIRVIHRLGRVNVGEPSFSLEIVAPHRTEAFAACQWLIDEMKRLVPIWKKPLKRGT
jgi:molybdopterin synthase catalytic subunit